MSVKSAISKVISKSLKPLQPYVDSSFKYYPIPKIIEINSNILKIPYS